LPFGVLPEDVAPWDKLQTTEEIQTALRSFAAINTQSSWFVSLNCDIKAVGDVTKALEEEGYNNITPVAWIKEGFNQVCPQSQLLKAFETIVTARISRTPEVAFSNLDQDPSKRHNIIMGPPNRNYQLRPDGKKVNPTEKPEYVFRWFLDRFARPGEWVLICGAGAGEEVRAAIKAGFNVVAIDSDKEQCQLLHNQMTTMEARDQQAAKKLAAKEAKKKGGVKGGATDGENKEELDVDGCAMCGMVASDEFLVLPCHVCSKKVCKKEVCSSGEGASTVCADCVDKAKTQADAATEDP
jgi:hypothetical protein